MNFKEKVSPLNHSYESIIQARSLAERISKEDAVLLCSRDLKKEDNKFYHWNTDKRLRLKLPSLFI